MTLNCGAPSSSRAKSTTPTLIWAVAGTANKVASAAPKNILRNETCTTDPTFLKSLSDRELESFVLVGINDRIALVCIERKGVAEPENTQRREPLNRQARRVLQFIILKPVLDRRTQVPTQEGVAIAGGEDVAHIVEPGQSRGSLELLRQRNQQFRARRDLEIAAERPAVVVLGSETAFLVATHG